MNPKVSIIVPVYNAENYLHECLDSLLTQTLKDIEIIAINDGSVDTSLEILNNYAKKHSNLKVINQKNKGISLTREVGIKHCSGDYIGFCDNDDFVASSMFEKLYTTAQKTDSDITFCNYADTNEQGDIIEDKNLFLKSKRKPILDALAKNKNLNTLDYKDLAKISLPWLKLYKKEIFKNFKIKYPNVNTAEDIGLSFQTYAAAKTFAVVPENLYFYRQRQGQVSRETSKNCFDVPKVLALTEEFLKENDLHKNYEDVFEPQKIWILLRTLSNTNYKYKKEFFKICQPLLKTTPKKYLQIPKGRKKIILNSVLNQNYFIYLFLADAYKPFRKLYDKVRGKK
ncbi:MAG: glycosyltransferase [Elusimicrobiaceae bacterium]|nr:glycosyltransferase [Elusimicrobiaceae bacterium]